MSLRTTSLRSLRALRATSRPLTKVQVPGCGCGGDGSGRAPALLIKARQLSTSTVARKSSPPNMAAAVLTPHSNPLQQAPLLRENTRDAWAQDPLVSYEEVKKVSQQPSDNILLVDVREPDEVALGTIPSAVSLPLSRIDDVLTLGYNPGSFQQEFAFPKPQPNQNIIFYCRSGRRSALACEVANRHGYLNTRNFVGSWLEWCDQEGIDNGED